MTEASGTVTEATETVAVAKYPPRPNRTVKVKAAPVRRVNVLAAERLAVLAEKQRLRQAPRPVRGRSGGYEHIQALQQKIAQDDARLSVARRIDKLMDHIAAEAVCRTRHSLRGASSHIRTRRSRQQNPDLPTGWLPARTSSTGKGERAYDRTYKTLGRLVLAWAEREGRREMEEGQGG